MSRDSSLGRFEEALVETLLPLEDVAPEDRPAVVAQVASFVRSQLEALPGALRVLMSTGFWGFRLATRLRFLVGYTALPLPTRRRWVEQWAYGSLGLGRQLFRAVRSTSLVAYYEHPEVRSKLVAPTDDGLDEPTGQP